MIEVKTSRIWLIFKYFEAALPVLMFVISILNLFLIPITIAFNYDYTPFIVFEFITIFIYVVDIIIYKKRVQNDSKILVYSNIVIRA